MVFSRTCRRCFFPTPLRISRPFPIDTKDTVTSLQSSDLGPISSCWAYCSVLAGPTNANKLKENRTTGPFFKDFLIIFRQLTGSQMSGLKKSFDACGIGRFKSCFVSPRLRFYQRSSQSPIDIISNPSAIWINGLRLMSFGTYKVRVFFSTIPIKQRYRGAACHIAFNSSRRIDQYWLILHIDLLRA